MVKPLEQRIKFSPMGNRDISEETRGLAPKDSKSGTIRLAGSGRGMIIRVGDQDTNFDRQSLIKFLHNQAHQKGFEKISFEGGLFKRKFKKIEDKDIKEAFGRYLGILADQPKEVEKPPTKTGVTKVFSSILSWPKKEKTNEDKTKALGAAKQLTKEEKREALKQTLSVSHVLLPIKRTFHLDPPSEQK